MRFNPAVEQALLEQVDRVVLQFPFYWYSSPPILKAWIDQVFLSGFAYGHGGNKLHGKELMLVVSTGGPVDSYQAGALNSFTMAEFLTPFQQTALMVGMTYLQPFVLHSAMSRDQTRLNASIPELISCVTSPRHKAIDTRAPSESASAQNNEKSIDISNLMVPSLNKALRMMEGLLSDKLGILVA